MTKGILHETAGRRDPATGIEPGHFARKQLQSRSRLVSWVHRGRFEAGLDLFRQWGQGRVVDYGCGDGTFLGVLSFAGVLEAPAVGLELDAEVLADCRHRFTDANDLSFSQLARAFVESHCGKFDTVLCMEVLEHVVEVEAIVDELANLLRPGGRLIVSVPVETGLPILAKQTIRTILGWWGVGDYPGTSPYTVGELWRSVFAGDRQHVERPVHVSAGFSSHDHKGFNWRALARSLDRRFVIERVASSPIRWLPPELNSQVWFLATRRPESHVSDSEPSDSWA